MKQIIFIISIFACLSASAQTTQTAPAAPVTTTLNYRIDYIRPDSFYLVEIKTTTDAPGKRGKTEEESVLLQDTAQIRLIIEKSLQTEAEMERKLMEYRTMRATVTELYGTLRERIKTGGNQ